MSDNARVFEGIWIPAELWFSRDLSITEKAIFLEVKSMDKSFGCTATNKKIGEVLELKPPTVSGILKVLENKGYIRITYKDLTTHSGRVINVLKYGNKATPQEESKGVQQKSNAPQEESNHSNIISNTNSTIDSKLSNAELPPEPAAAELTDMDKCRMFIEKFNRLKGQALNKKKPCEYKALNSVCGQLKNRLKTFKSVDIFKALSNAFKDEYHIKTKFKYVIPEYVLRENILDKYLNAETAETIALTQKRELVH